MHHVFPSFRNWRSGLWTLIRQLHSGVTAQHLHRLAPQSRRFIRLAWSGWFYIPGSRQHTFPAPFPFMSAIQKVMLVQVHRRWLNCAGAQKKKGELLKMEKKSSHLVKSSVPASPALRRGTWTCYSPSACWDRLQPRMEIRWHKKCNERKKRNLRIRWRKETVSSHYIQSGVKLVMCNLLYANSQLHIKDYLHYI